MKDLKKYRDEIDKIDKEIVTLFEKRMDVIKDITSFKKENGLPIEDKDRENKMIEKNKNLIKKPEYKEYYEYVLKGYLSASKKMQEDIIDKK